MRQGRALHRHPLQQSISHAEAHAAGNIAHIEKLIDNCAWEFPVLPCARLSSSDFRWKQSLRRCLILLSALDLNGSASLNTRRKRAPVWRRCRTKFGTDQKRATELRCQSSNRSRKHCASKVGSELKLLVISRTSLAVKQTPRTSIRASFYQGGYWAIIWRGITGSRGYDLLA